MREKEGVGWVVWTLWVLMERMRGVSMFLLSLYLPFVVGVRIERERESE